MFVCGELSVSNYEKIMGEFILRDLREFVKGFPQICVAKTDMHH